jgi:phenylalanyl-tRNA synthetase beta chain
MRVPVSWLRSHVDFPQTTGTALAARLTEIGLKVESVDETGTDIRNVVVAQVRAVEDLTGFKKPIRWVTLTDGTGDRQVICGATNFSVGDLVAYARPPAALPGGFVVERRPAYGRDSDGMICSARELGLGDDHTGILTLDLEIDTLGTDVVDALELRDTVLDIAVNPDRGYAMSVRGVAREVATAYGAQFRDPAAGELPDGRGDGHPVEIEDPTGCDRYVALVLAGIDPKAPSPRWLQRRLTLAGMRPISLPVDVTNHVMLDLGQPLHAFDRATVRGGIVVRRAGPGERIRTLDGVDRSLDTADLVIADDSGPIAIAGVMGGAATEVTGATTEVLVESAHFDAVSVARSARRHKLPSEASRRFERGVDPAVAPAGAWAAARLLGELGGAAIGDAAVTDVDVRPERPRIELDPRLPARVAGLDYTDDVVQQRLADVGCAVERSAEAWSVVPPSWRPDLIRAVDLVEEVVRLEGYDRLPASIPSAPAGRGLTRSQRQRRQVGRTLAALGYAEVLSYPFVAADVGDRLQLAPDDVRRPTVRLANPVSDEEPMLRAALLGGLLTVLGRNVGRGYPDVALFETGLVFHPAADPARTPTPPAGTRPTDSLLAEMDRTLPAQPLHAAVVVCGAWERPGWWGTGRPAGWADVLEAARRVGADLGVEVGVEPADGLPFHPGRCAALTVAGRVIGHGGELHPRVLEAFDLPARSAAMEIALEPLLQAAPEAPQAPQLSAFPPATLDISLVVADDVPAAAVERTLREGAGLLVETLRLFDVYRGGQVPPGHRSLAYALRLRAPDRTLTVEEATAARDAAVALAGERHGAVLRS